MLRRDDQHRPIAAKPAPAEPGALALSLPQERWQTVRWREGSADWLAARFARLRLRLLAFSPRACPVGHRDNLLAEPRAEEWLLIERPEDETEPTKYWFASLPEDIAFDRLVSLAKLRGGSSAIIKS